MDENHPENEENYQFYGWKQNAITELPLQEKQVWQRRKLFVDTEVFQELLYLSFIIDFDRF